MGMFSNMAAATTTLSPLIEGKEKLSTQEVIENMGGVVTIIEFDTVIQGDNDWYPVILVKEQPNRFMFGGLVLRKIVETWIAAFEGDVAACSKALKAEGGVKVKMSQAKTKNGRTVTKVVVL